MNNTPHPEYRMPQRGFTLLEVLIAIVIFSIGLMGIAGLQASGMRYTQDSQLRTIAIAQAETMADRMRADPVGVSNSKDNKFYDTRGVMPTEASAGYVDCYDVACTKEQVAMFSLVNWNKQAGNAARRDSRPQESNDQLLPNGDGIVCLDSTPNDGISGAWACDNLGDIYAIKVRWRERLIGNNDTATGPDADPNMDAKKVVITVVPYRKVTNDNIF